MGRPGVFFLPASTRDGGGFGLASGPGSSASARRGRCSSNDRSSVHFLRPVFNLVRAIGEWRVGCVVLGGSAYSPAASCLVVWGRPGELAVLRSCRAWLTAIARIDVVASDFLSRVDQREAPARVSWYGGRRLVVVCYVGNLLRIFHAAKNTQARVRSRSGQDMRSRRFTGGCAVGSWVRLGHCVTCVEQQADGVRSRWHVFPGSASTGITGPRG